MGEIPDAPEFWRVVFGTDAPVEIEIGSGDGTFLLAIGARHPTRSFLGVERSPSRVRRVEARLAKIAIPNVRMLQSDAACVVTSLIPTGSVTAYHVYFPDPWPKRGHAHRRLLNAPFVAGMARTLALDGRVFVATDVEGYAAVARERVLADGRFCELATGNDHPGLATSFARKYRAAGRRLHAFTFARIVPAAADQVFAASKMRSM